MINKFGEKIEAGTKEAGDHDHPSEGRTDILVCPGQAGHASGRPASGGIACPTKTMKP